MKKECKTVAIFLTVSNVHWKLDVLLSYRRTFRPQDVVDPLLDNSLTLIHDKGGNCWQWSSISLPLHMPNSSIHAFILFSPSLDSLVFLLSRHPFLSFSFFQRSIVFLFLSGIHVIRFRLFFFLQIQQSFFYLAYPSHVLQLIYLSIFFLLLPSP